MRRSGGRNAHGHITRRHQGGGHKRRYRIIDFKRLDKDIGVMRKRLANPSFTAKAPPEVVAEATEQLAALEEQRAKLADAEKLADELN